MARARLALGLLLYKINKDECAAEVLRAGLSYAPDLVEAHVWLGFVYGRLIAYEEMVGEFVEAIYLDEGAARAAVGGEPEEVVKIRQVLYGQPEESAQGWHPAVPPQLREAWDLAGTAAEHIRVGRDSEAVAALERSVTLDPVSQHAIAMLSFAYLLDGRERAAWAHRTTLWQISPWLARLIFEH
jgi:tetratricopeptide (TPR) repeat protein